MSLVVRLWIAILIVVLISIVGGVAISAFTSKRFFEEQLYLKNMDNANMLAMTLSTMDKDPITLEIFIATQFDIGHYRRIELIDIDGEPLVSNEASVELAEDIPQWFIEVFTPKVEPGVSLVTDGWSQFGTLYVETGINIALETMWKGARRLVFGMGLVAVFAGMFGSMVLRLILNPLGKVVDQAEALGQMRYIKVKEPGTKELRRVVKVMNTLSDRFKRQMDEEYQRLDALRLAGLYESRTGVAKADYFNTMLDSQLAFRDADGRNVLVVVRVDNFRHIIKDYPADLVAQTTHGFLLAGRTSLARLRHDFTDVRTGHINESEVGVLITEVFDLEYLIEVLESELLAFAESSQIPLKIGIAAGFLRVHESRIDLLERVRDMVFESARSGKPVIDHSDFETVADANESRWKQALSEALQARKVDTFNYPMLDYQRNFVHYQAWLGVDIHGELRKSGYFAHWARHLLMMDQVDYCVTDFLLEKMKRESNNYEYALLLSAQLLQNPETLAQLYYRLSREPEYAKRLWLEFREETVSILRQEFAVFCQTVKNLGCKVGLKRVGESFAEIINVQELGLDYVKLDSSFIHDITNTPASQQFIKGFCTLAHSFNMRVFADGVTNSDDTRTLEQLGVDGEIAMMEVIEAPLPDEIKV